MTTKTLNELTYEDPVRWRGRTLRVALIDGNRRGLRRLIATPDGDKVKTFLTCHCEDPAWAVAVDLVTETEIEFCSRCRASRRAT